MVPTRRSLRVLLVEDSEPDAELVLRELRRLAYEVTSERVDAPDALREALAVQTWDLVICDYSMPAFDALAALQLVGTLTPNVPVIVISGAVGEEAAVEALRAGARDFLVKGRLARLGPAIERELAEARLRVSLRRAEEQLVHAQKMDALGRLAGAIAHDFNNLLSIVIVFSEMLIGDFEVGDPRRADVEEIQKAGGRAAELTRQLLALSRQQVLAPRILDLGALVSGSERMLERLLGAGVELETTISSSPLHVNVDPAQFEHVILNLVVNARDAMPKGGVLKIALSSIELDESEVTPLLSPARPGPYVVVDVSDNGVGMDRETRARVFEPFFTTKERGRGTGLGLSTVFGIIAQSGGHILVESELGRGTTFRIFLPRTDREASAPSPAAARSSALDGHEVILLVDDDDGVRGAAAALLQRHGYRVVSAVDASHAVRIASEHAEPVELIVTDLMMARLNGLELVGELRRIMPNARVLVMSGKAHVAAMEQGLVPPDLPFIEKPLSAEPFLLAVRRALAPSAR